MNKFTKLTLFLLAFILLHWIVWLLTLLCIDTFIDISKMPFVLWPILYFVSLMYFSNLFITYLHKKFPL